jgi:hypothetical protein
MELHNRTDLPPYNPALYQKILSEGRLFLLPELTAGSGQFPHSKPRIVEDDKTYAYQDIVTAVRQKNSNALPPSFLNYEVAIATLRISLVQQTLTAFERVGLEPGIEIYTEGGFRKDEAYNMLLSAALPENPVALTDIVEASAFGTAMTAKMAITGKSLAELSDDFSIEYISVTKTPVRDISTYRKRWLTLAE